MLQLSGHGGADPPVVTFAAVNICDAVVETCRSLFRVCGGWSDHVGVAVDNPHNADIAVIVLR